MNWYSGSLVTVALLLGPNLAWLTTSSVRLYNASDVPMDQVVFVACGKAHAINTLVPGKAVFRLLPACGDDTLIIRLAAREFCQTYVEGESYHIDVTIHAAETVRCSYANPFSTLFVAKLFI